MLHGYSAEITDRLELFSGEVHLSAGGKVQINNTCDLAFQVAAFFMREVKNTDMVFMTLAYDQRYVSGKII